MPDVASLAYEPALRRSVGGESVRPFLDEHRDHLEAPCARGAEQDAYPDEVMLAEDIVLPAGLLDPLP